MGFRDFRFCCSVMVSAQKVPASPSTVRRPAEGGEEEEIRPRVGLLPESGSDRCPPSRGPLGEGQGGPHTTPRRPARGPQPDLSVRPTSVHCGVQMKETGVPFLRINSTPHTHTHIQTYTSKPWAIHIMTHALSRPQIRTGEWRTCRAGRSVRRPLPSTVGRLRPRQGSLCLQSPGLRPTRADPLSPNPSPWPLPSSPGPSAGPKAQGDRGHPLE